MKIIDTPVYLKEGKIHPATSDEYQNGKDKTITDQILKVHHKEKDDSLLHITFDSLTSHDITYVGIIQTARASGLEEFPVPYVLTNCHNTLCAVGGTINEDDHQFALSAAHKYGGIYVPPNMAVIHSYNREMMSGLGKMILGSDSHTRYGALGTMGIGEGGGEIAKQLLGKTYDIAYPKVICIYLSGKVKPGIGPHDVALTLIGKTYESGLLKNAVLEFVGPGIHNLSQDFRNGIDVMTTETTCLSSIWQTDEITNEYFTQHGRSETNTLSPKEGASYDACVEINLEEIESMIALPMHPSKVYSIHELQENPKEILTQAEKEIEQLLGKPLTYHLIDKIHDGKIHVDQGIIAGCSGGTYENIMAAKNILTKGNTGKERFRLSIYPDSMPIQKALVDNGCISSLLMSGVTFREAFCGPCFGAGDTPATGEFSIRHTTRNFPNREGSKPNEGQLSFVALMDARSIAATAINGGILTAATDIIQEEIEIPSYTFETSLYAQRVYDGFGKPQKDIELVMGPNIKDWPIIPELKESLLLQVASHIDDPVTTTDELIPSGETSSYRSNPLRLAEFTLSRKDPEYVTRAKRIQGYTLDAKEIQEVFSILDKEGIEVDLHQLNIASCIYANQPGDGSAREQAASCQRVLGGGANLAKSYATKRYRSNCINWGIVPFEVKDAKDYPLGAFIYIPHLKSALQKAQTIEAYVITDQIKPVTLGVGTLTNEEIDILCAGCLINYYK